MKKLTNLEKSIVNSLCVHPYNVEYLTQWINRDDNVFINAPAALNAMGAKGFYRAVQEMAKLVKGMVTGSNLLSDTQKKMILENWVKSLKGDLQENVESLMEEILHVILDQPDCSTAEHDASGCLGYCRSETDDEPCDYCKECPELNVNKENSCEDV